MRVSALLLLSLFTLVWATNSQLAHAKSGRHKTHGKSKIRDASVVFQRTIIDLGDVKQGQVIKQKFYFKNEGTTDLKFLRVDTPCGCLLVTGAEEHGDLKNFIHPKGEGYLEVAFDSARFRGPVQKMIKLTTNDLARPEVSLLLRANVHAEFIASPPVLDFSQLEQGTTSKALEFAVEPQDGFPFKMEGLQYNDKVFDVAYRQVDKHWQFRVTLKELAPGVQHFKEKIFVLNNSQYLPKLEVMAIGNAQGHISYLPAYLDFGALKKQDISERQLVFHGDQPFKIAPKQPEVLVKDAPVAILADLVEAIADPEQPSTYRVKLRNSAQLSGNVHGKLHFAASDGHDINVDFYAYFH